MSKKTKTAPAAEASADYVHADVGAGRAPSLDLDSARAIAAANKAVGFEPPPSVQAVLDEAGVTVDQAVAWAAERAGESAPAAPAPTTPTPTDTPPGGDAGDQE